MACHRCRFQFLARNTRGERGHTDGAPCHKLPSIHWPHEGPLSDEFKHNGLPCGSLRICAHFGPTEHHFFSGMVTGSEPPLQGASKTVGAWLTAGFKPKLVARTLSNLPKIVRGSLPDARQVLTKGRASAPASPRRASARRCSAPQARTPSPFPGNTPAAPKGDRRCSCQRRI